MTSFPFQHIAITGGCGFIGTHLARLLLPQVASLRIIDNLSTSTPDQLPKDAKVKFFQGSVLDEALLREALHGVDLVLHLAGNAGARLDRQQKEAVFRDAALGTETILRASGEIPLVLFSSAILYGMDAGAARKKYPTREDALAIDGGTEGYACGKLRSEELVFVDQNSRGRKALIVRPFNVVGPGQRSHQGAVVPTFFERSLRGDPLVVDASRACFFTDVRTLCQCLSKLIAVADAWRPESNLVDLGSKHSIRIVDLASKIAELTRSKSEITPATRTTATLPAPDSQHLETLLGHLVDWPPLDEILRDIYLSDFAATAPTPAG
jgi:UDP-glucose 4-epimerase